ncbi:MAG: hypothetical protein HW374_1160 [Bacteroidetes bacterium]|nr:hypothetical protein [Bacteroidota bacterium]
MISSGFSVSRVLRFVVFFAILFLPSMVRPQSVFPQNSPEFLYQTSSDLRARMTVMTVSLRPGVEDFATMAYFRYGLGAKLVSLYVTNGESGESDSSGTLPHELAAISREEAYNAARRLAGDAYFLNLPDIAAASDNRLVRNLWPSDTLRARVHKAIGLYRPDVVILFQDRSPNRRSLSHQILDQELLSIAKSSNVSSTVSPQGRITKAFVADQGKQAKAFQVSGIDSIRQKSFVVLGADARRSYRSKQMWGEWDEVGGRSKYKVLYPERTQKSDKPETGLTPTVSNRLVPLQKRIHEVCSTIQSGLMRGGNRTLDTVKILTNVSSILEDVDDSITRIYSYPYFDQVALLRWKSELESVRTILLGVRVYSRLAENVLTERQLTFLTIDTISGLTPGGVLQVHFPMVSQGWVVNESLERKLPLMYGESYRLLSPQKLAYHLPQSGNGLQNQRFAEQLNVVLVHQHPDKNKNFQVRLIFPLFYAPRFTVEGITPIVRAVPWERLVVRLTNHSRDGVRDKVYVKDSTVVSDERTFRLNTKDASFQDTLALHWQKELKEGSYLIPITIGGQIAGQFAARKFEAEVDTSKTVGLITGIVGSQTAEALRRLGVRFEVMDAQSLVAERIADFRTLIVDRRAMTLVPQFKETLPILHQFVTNGGHLVILAQESNEWNQARLLEGVRLENSTMLDHEMVLEFDTTNSLLRYPNSILAEDWDEWIFRRSYNHVSVIATSKGVETPVKVAKNKWPLLLTSKMSRGRISYVDLDLQHQWMNLHAGSFKLLANLLSH